MMKQLITLCLLTLSSFSCDPPGDSRFWITNSTDDSLYYFKAYERFPLPGKNPFRPYDTRGFYPHERRNFPLGTGKWDGIITLNSPHDSTLQLYVFRKRVIETTPWDTIRKRRLYRLYRLRLDELQQADWKVIIQ